MADRPIAEDWYKRSFDALYPVIYAHRTVEAAAPEAAFAMDQLRLTPQDRVLDLCCGNGRHMAHVLGRTPFVIGLDYSADLLALARAQIGEGGRLVRARGRLVRADMRRIPFEPSFDVVVNFFTSFGYFLSQEENAAVVREVARVLKPSGRVFIDYLNPAYVERALVPESVRTQGEYTIEERRWIDTGQRRVNKVTTASCGGEPVGQWGESVRLYEESEFRSLLEAGGLAVDAVFGNYGGQAVSENEPRMIVVGHKA
ncbi:MAG: methyltransferase domain-containing protein [Nitrospiraceae bacterium]|nr:methyltransferase domain-containing protein [Nitrospiraceae bacterium]